MKEIEEQILARKDEVVANSTKKKDKKVKGKAAQAAAEAAESTEEDVDTINEDIIANADDEDFEEFTPAEE